MSNKSFKEVIEEARGISSRFKKIEGKKWGLEGAMIELSKQVGDLSKLVMVKEKYYYPDREKENSTYGGGIGGIGDELIDIFIAIVRVADYYELDLEEVFERIMKEADDYLVSRGL